MADDPASPSIEIKIHLPGIRLDIRLVFTAAALVRFFRRIMGLPAGEEPADPMKPLKEWQSAEQPPSPGIDQAEGRKPESTRPRPARPRGRKAEHDQFPRGPPLP